MSWTLGLPCAVRRVFPLQMGYTGVCSGLEVAGTAAPTPVQGEPNFGSEMSTV